ncbi:hypothetical protein BDP81DRAFT_394898 [Colletotrichum phormii]|uniref:Uncharacterized protein n=1 Tax=Colletotrichum phormii TaxID=359342 RepID=A0AAI9ZSZ9_9PEZI|nr:uncharacterized protein BDP81DRAFT_394898 [Colletotrichum phormii]KAK1636284.1 hypothetical protein BDP81DRAFT_394898 [Colletotrichum phormii]
MLEAFQSIIEVGISFIPGGAALNGARAAVKGAKTFAENGLEAASFFGDWVGPACGVHDWKFDLFGALVNAPDSMGVSTGCHKKDKAACKRMESKPDPMKKPDSPTEKTRTGYLGKSSTASPVHETSTGLVSSTISSETACVLAARAAKPLSRVGVVGDAENSERKCGKSVTVHLTETVKPIGFYETRVPNIKCRRQWSQACYHYSSVMEIHRNTRSMTEWTCGATQSTSNDGSATDVWGSTAVASLALTNQHWGWPWANGFVPRRVLKHANGLPKRDKYGNEIAVGCDRDEFPPRYFWPKDNEAEKKGMVQRIRFLPYDENRKAGAMWRGFCNKNAAQSSTTRTSTVTSFIQSKFIRTVNANSRTAKGLDGTTTVTSWVSIETARAIFKITDWDGLPKDTKWYGLRDNKCWPNDLTPDDPGWVLLTNDEFYAAGQHPDLAPHTQSYRGLPDLTLLRRVLQQRKNSPPFEFRELNSTEYDGRKIREGNGDGQIPRAYRDNVLPGMPQPKRRRRMIWAEENNDAQVRGEDQYIDSLEDLHDDDFERQIGEYIHDDEETSLKMPRETEAIQTPAGQGDIKTAPPSQASSATDGLPRHTHGPHH